MTPPKRRPPLRLTACLLAAAAIPLLSHTPRAFATDWIGTGTDWNTAGNWSPGIVPNSSFSIANFNDQGVGAVNISSSVTLQSLNFNNLAGNYSITSSTNQTLTVQNITVAQGVTGTETFNLAPNAIGNLLYPSGSPLTITNNSTLASLVIGASTTIGTPGFVGVFFNGPGAVTLAGSFVVGGGNAVTAGLTKNGSGLLDFSGNGTGLGGTITLSGGTLDFDYATSTASKVGSSSGLLLKGGVFNLNANASAVTQTIATGLFVSSGHTDITASGTGGAITLTFTGTSTRTAGATLDVSAGLTVNAPGLTLSGGILSNGFATFNSGATWATSLNASTISGLAAASYNANTFNSLTSNTDVTLSAAPAANISVNSLRFNTGNLLLTLSGTNNVISSGAILATPSAGNATITGGTIVSTTGELVVQVYDGAGLTITSAIQATSLTKAGPSALALSGNNTALTGAININRGSLIVNNINSISNASKINFNDLRAGLSLQTFTIDLGTNSAANVSQPILISAFGKSPVDGSPGPATSFSTGNSVNSLITLSGVISSAAGQNTSIQFTGNSSTSGFNLTGANTFTGNITLASGSLHINSDAALGNAANVLSLTSTTFSSIGGLVFANSGINVAHNIVASNFNGITSNNTDVNTVSGQISGTTWSQNGSGTVILANPANSFTSLSINAGTVSVGADGDLGAANALLALQSGTLKATASFTTGAARSISVVSSGTINTDPFATLSLTQGLSGNGQLFKTGAGTLAFAPATATSVSITVNAGTLALNQNTLSGGFVNNATVTGSAAFTTNFANLGNIIASGPLVISGNIANSNAGNISLASPTAGLVLSGSQFINTGAIVLNSASVTGSVQLNNSAGGIINGPGFISAPFVNNSGATLFNAGVSPLNVSSAFTNAGVIQLGAATASISGGLITNTGTISGFGTVANTVFNTTGTIEPTGGTLLIANTVINNGTIRTAAGTKILIQGSADSFPTNNGLISLAGGTFDNGGQSLDNTGQITGFGVLSTGGLTNDGAITFTGGTTTVNGNVTNDFPQTINVQYQPAVFTGNVTNLGTFNVTGTTVTFTGTYSGNAYHSDPATNIFQNSATITAGGAMTGQAGDKFIFTGGAFTNNGTFTNGGALESAVNFSNTGAFTQSGTQKWSPNTTFTNSAGTASFLSDPGASAPGNLSLIVSAGTVNLAAFDNLKTLTLTGGTTVFGTGLNASPNAASTTSISVGASATFELAQSYDFSSPSAPALTGSGTIVIDPGITLTLAVDSAFSGTIIDNGTLFLDPALNPLAPTFNFSVLTTSPNAIPEPASLLLLALSAPLLLRRRK